MEEMVPRLRRRDKRRLERRAKKTKDRKLAIRCLIVLNLAERRPVSDTASALGVSRSTVYRVAER
jgi:transposase-like protein